MANDAFALSPISARAALPSEDDYQAISDAFMETSRGRWFLTEYARRNRNADTTMVLEAVARIETSIATQKQVELGATLANAAEAMRGFVAEASADATSAIDRFNNGHDAAPTLRGLRIIREVAWRLREVGYDSRICDILETQADHIDGNSAPRPIHDLRAAVLGAFEKLSQQLDEIAAPNGRAYAAPAAQVSTPQAAAPEPVVPEILDADEASAPETSMLETSEPAVDLPEADEAPQAEAIEPDVSAAIAEVAVNETVVDVAPEPIAEAAAPTTEPEAIAAADLEIAATPAAEPATAAEEIALAPTPDHDEVSIGDGAQDAAATTATLSPSPIAAASESLAFTADVTPATPESEAAPTMAAAMVEAAPTAHHASLVPPNTLSLGESLLARGMVTTPANKPDPLAPIRRMSQAEKIAFFS